MLVVVVGSSKRSRSVEDDDSEKPKRPCSAFGYYMQAHKTTFAGFNSVRDVEKID